MSKTWFRSRRPAMIAAASVVALGLAACGSSADDGSNGSSSAAPSGSSTETAASGEIDINKVYAEGVPTMAELYQGSSTTPPTSAPKPQPGKSVWFMPCDSGTPACLDVGTAAKEAGEKIGWKVTIVDGKFGAGGAFATGIRQAIAAKADGFVLYGINCQGLEQPLAEAKAAGMKVMIQSGLDCTESGGSESFVTAPYISTEDIPDSGTKWAEAMAANSAHYVINATGGQAKLLMVHGTIPQLDIAAQAFYREFAKCTGCEIIDDVKYEIADLTPNGPWIQAWRQALIKNGANINSAYPEWDGHMDGLGGLAAIEEAGLEGVITFGGEGTTGTFQAIRDGSLTALTKVHSAGWLGYGAIDTLNRAFQGQPSVPQGSGMTVVDINNNMPAEGEAYEPDVDYKAAYLKIWGVS